MSFNLIRKDITTIKADAIVNTANTRPIVGGGVDFAIYLKAGHDLLVERKKIGVILSGEARITSAFNLPAEIIIHTVSPYVNDDNSEVLLRKCYRNALNLAVEHGCDSIAFPLIGAGTCGFPSQVALEIATEEITSFLENNELEVYLTVLDRKSFKISNALFDEVKSYIDDVEAEEKLREYRYMDIAFASLNAKPTGMASKSRKAEADIPSWMRLEERDRKIKHELPEEKADDVDEVYAEPCVDVSCLDSAELNWNEVVNQKEEGFSEYLMKKIIESGRTDADVYKRANLDRKLFSKIRNDKNYKPKKYTALALAISLQLDKEEALNLIGKAGYTLTRSSKGDLIIEYCLDHNKYNIIEINEVLYHYDQPLLGSVKY